MKETITKILDESGYKENTYFTALKSGKFDKEDFTETQIQFFSAVNFFNRPMGALAAKIPTANLRVEVIRNVWEEHGEGDVDQFHSNTFVVFLKRLAGITSNDIARRALWPEVRIFNTTLAGACILDEYMIGAGVMGIIERMFCDISAWIGQAVVDLEWLKKEELVHYNLHKDLDIKHAEDFFNVLKPAWQESQENKYFIEQGLWMGANLFNGLYEGLYKARNRRVFREVRGHHTRA